MYFFRFFGYFFRFRRLLSFSEILCGLFRFFGGFAVGLCVCCAMGCALAMALPISTPPNALAYATGMVENKSMSIVGAILGVAGLAIAVAMMYLLDLINFF